MIAIHYARDVSESVVTCVPEVRVYRGPLRVLRAVLFVLCSRRARAAVRAGRLGVMSIARGGGSA